MFGELFEGGGITGEVGLHELKGGVVRVDDEAASREVTGTYLEVVGYLVRCSRVAAKAVTAFVPLPIGQQQAAVSSTLSPPLRAVPR